MSWHPYSDMDPVGVDANRDLAFPPLQAEHDDGSWDTQLVVTVPFLVNSDRYQDLLDSLERWAEDQGLTDFLPEGEGLTYTTMPRAKIKEDDES